MSVPEETKPVKKRTFLRVWLPILIVAGAVAATAGIWLWPSAAFERSSRGPATINTVAISVALLTIWLVFLSGLRWWTRGVLLVLEGGILFLAYLNVQFDGDMVPSFPVLARWSRAARLESHRRNQGNSGDLKPIEVTDLPTDFPEYRGRKRDGVVRTGPSLARDWKNSPAALWRQPVGVGYASFAVVGNVAVTIEQRRDHEAVVCYDTAKGREHWVYSYPAFFSEKLGGDGPRATPTIADGDVFSLGATGTLSCLELKTGRLKWACDILEGNKNLQWGMSGSPLVYNQVVVVNPGVQESASVGGSVVAYDRGTGKLLWKGGTSKAGYTSPMLATLAGKQQIVLLEGKQLGGYDANDGHPLWQYPWETFSDINAAQPLVLEGYSIFVSSGYDKGCAMVKISESGGTWSAKALWGDPPSRVLRCKFSSPVAHKGCIYGLNEGTLVSIDANTGKRKWQGGRYGHGQLLLDGDLLVILSESGKLALVEASPGSEKVLGDFQAIEGKTWNNFAIADGKIYLRNAEEMACYDLAKR
jgi:outer membrane protein assembly factor BamB